MHCTLSCPCKPLIQICTIFQVKAKRQQTVVGTINGSCVNSRTRRSGRISKKAISDVNEDLLTSVLLAMDQRRSRLSSTPNDLIICGSKYRRSFRLSAKRKQMKSPNLSSNGSVIRRKTSVQSNAPNENCTEVCTAGVITDGYDGHTMEKCDRVRRSRRTRSRHSENLCRER